MTSIVHPALTHDAVAQACLLYETAVSCYAKGEAKQAESSFRRSLRLFKKHEGPNHPDVAQVLINLAVIYEDRCEYGAAERMCQRAVRVMEQTGDDGDADVTLLRLQAWSCLGRLHRVQGRYDQAESLYQRALEIAEQSFSPDGPEVATVLNELAVLYKDMGRFSEAGRLYQQALALMVKTLGADHTEVATIYHNLGGLEHAAGNFARGVPFARRAVQIRTRVLGPDHLDTAADVAALAALLDGQKKYAEAEVLYWRALDVFERHYGAEHYEIAVNLNNLAAVAHAQGRSEEAEQLYRRALAIKEKLFGPEHPDCAMTLNNLAVFYKAQKKYAEAEPLYQRALAIFEEALGAEHPNVAVCLDNYGELLRKMKRTGEARALEAQARSIRRGQDLLSEEGVAVTDTINPQFACFVLAVRPSPVHRRGVFAAEPIPARRKVIEYTGERITRREARRRSGRALHYLFQLDNEWLLDGAVGGSGAEYLNHSCEPNLFTRRIKGHILFFSKRQIEPGEELTIDYRFSPTAEKVLCRCGSWTCRGTINQKSENLLV